MDSVRPSVPDPPELSGRLWEGFGGAYGWDVGANCGQSLPDMCRLFDRFTAFEPCRGSFDFYHGLFSFADIRQVAVSDRDGELELAFPAKEQKETGQLVTIGIKGMEWEPLDWAAVEKVTVPCRTADSLAAELGVPDFMKVDTEGHEAAVLLGAQGILKTGQTDFLIEFHSPENYKQCRLELEGASYWIKTVRHPHYPEGSHMWSQHGWIKAFAPRRLAGRDVQAHAVLLLRGLFPVGLRGDSRRDRAQRPGGGAVHPLVRQGRSAVPLPVHVR